MIVDTHITDFLHQYFDKIFVITLERAIDRQEKVRQNLLGLQIEYFMGVDKLNLDLEKLEAQGVYDNTRAKKLNRQGKGMILGHIACSLSHRALYQHIIQKQYKRVLVFEDDVVLLTQNLAKLLPTIKELPEDWDLVYFGYTKHEKITPELKRKQSLYKILSSLRLMKWNRTMVDNLLPVVYSEHLRIAGYHDCTHSYAISHAAASKLISVQTPVVFNSDNLLSYSVMNGHLNAFITEPKFFDQDNLQNPADHSFINH